MDDDMVTGSSEAIGKCIDIGMHVEFACGAIRLWTPLTWPILIRPDDPINKVISTLKHTGSEPTSINRLSGKNILDNRSYIANFGVVKRNVFEAIGGFDEEYLGWGFQDTDLMHRLCLEGYRYDLFSIYDIVVYHLAHQVDKGSNYELNRARFLEKQRLDGRIFRTNHFFEIYENDGYSLFSDFSEENIF
jgi:GT2 family glycosyltransferase